MVSSAGCRVQGDDGREYLDLVMGLGAVALGYGHPEVRAAVVDAVDRGVIGPVSPLEEESLAEDLQRLMPHLDRVRFLKTGAEAVAAAVRLSRAWTGRDHVLGAGYFGWLDWCSREAGVPESVQRLFAPIPFNDEEETRAAIRAAGDDLACVVVEPVIDEAPSPEWLQALREETHRVGAILVFDEIKTALRVSPGGAVERWGVAPDLVVLGKAIANGFPLSAVGGREDIMRGVEQTWISSTMATEFVSLAASRATLRAASAAGLHGHLASVGGRLRDGLARIAARVPDMVTGVGGIPEMCYLRFAEERVSSRVAVACARRGLLFKRSAYNFVSLSHQETDIVAAIATVESALEEVREHAPG
jgi:glutamate-1-semialdehyde aminotransferase